MTRTFVPCFGEANDAQSQGDGRGCDDSGPSVLGRFFSHGVPTQPLPVVVTTGLTYAVTR